MSSELFVILCVFKGDRVDYIRQSIESVLRQSYANFVLLIVKDGILTQQQEEYLSMITDSRVTYLSLEENKGLAVALNFGLEFAMENNASYIARMDADDICIEDRFKKQIDFLLNNRKIDVVGGAIEEINEDSSPTGKVIKYPKTHLECKRFFQYRDPLAHPSVMFSKP